MVSTEINQTADLALRKDIDELLANQRLVFDRLLAPVPREDFVLDGWQKEAIDQLEQGKHLIVDAVTTSGKTRIIEEIIQGRLADSRFKLVYTSPVKALSNDKYREFRQQFGDEAIGLMTGDFKENLGAKVVVATLESYRNTLLGIESALGPSMVVFDEYQFLSEKERGKAWEEAVILSSQDAQLVFLSASVPNVDDFHIWLRKIKTKEVAIVTNSYRPVPLKSVVFLDGQPLEKEAVVSLVGQYGRDVFPELSPEQTLPQLINHAIKNRLYPVIVYRGSRSDIKRDFNAFALHEIIPPLSSEERRAIEQSMSENQQMAAYLPRSMTKAIIEKGIAYHSSGLNPLGKLFVEILLKHGLLRVCFGTMGLSLGINFSVRSVIVGDEKRPQSGGSWTFYSPSELIQMSGRAGRRGIDNAGYLLQANLDTFNLWELEPEKCVSAFSLGVNSMLNLMERYKDEVKVIDIFNKSFRFRNHKHELDLNMRRCFSVLDIRGGEVDLEETDDPTPQEKTTNTPPVKLKSGYLVTDQGEVQVRFMRERLGSIKKRSEELSFLDSNLRPLDLETIKGGKKLYRVLKGPDFWVICMNRSDHHRFMQQYVRMEGEQGPRLTRTKTKGKTTGCKDQRCESREACDKYIRHPGVKLLKHLYTVEALTDQQLTDLGQLAALFPQTGSLVIADRLREVLGRDINEIRTALFGFASLCFDSHKGPKSDDHFRHIIYKKLLYYYPASLFPEMWETKVAKRSRRVIQFFREYNPLGIAIVKSFLSAKGDPWPVVKAQYVNPENYIEEGDLVHFFIKYLDILRSMKRVGDERLDTIVADVYQALWRSPIDLLVQGF